MANNFDYSLPFVNDPESNDEPPENPARHLEWVLDSGAAGNCTYISDFLRDTERIHPRAIISADGGRTVSNIQGEIDTNGISAKRVLYVPAIDSNLLSVGCLTKEDHVVVFDKNGCEIYNESDVIVQGVVKARGRLAKDGLYKLISNDYESLETYNKNLWHRRLCHIDVAEIQLLQDYMATGITMMQNNKSVQCVNAYCPNYFGLSNSPSILSAFNFNLNANATKALEVVYFYLSMTQCKMSLNGNKYYIIFIDDYTRKTFVYFCRSEMEIIPKLKMFTKYVEMYTGNKIKHMSTDYDTSYKKFYPYINSFCVLNDINVHYSNAETAIIEWLRFYTMSKKLCLVKESNLPNEFWAEVINAIVNLLNVCPNTGHPFMTPHEAWSGCKPNLSAVRVFGCKAYLPSLKKYVINLGYEFDRGEYRFMDTSHYGIYYKKTALFYENLPFFKSLSKVVE